jgi:signal transduction histidine kinase
MNPAELSPGSPARIRPSARRPDRFRAALETAIFLAAVLAFVLLALSLVDAQASLSDDRAGLLSLRESWAVAAAGFGLRGDLQASIEDFSDEYRLFRSRPSFQELLKADSTFAGLASGAEAALSRMEGAERRGRAVAADAAAEVDRTLALMAVRVGEWSRDRLSRSRLLLLALAGALAALGASFLILERRLKLAGADEARSRALSRALIAATEGERLRLSRELHDAVAQDLAAARLYAGMASGDDAARASGLIQRAIDEVREICHGLRPAELDNLGLTEASARLCADNSGIQDFSVEFRVEGTTGLRYEPETEINVYRILQEGLANARRHSGGTRARVTLSMGVDRIGLRVEDDGRGPGSSAPGLGRTGMEERARMLGGEFHLGPAAGRGAALSISLPARALARDAGPRASGLAQG